MIGDSMVNRLHMKLGSLAAVCLALASLANAQTDPKSDSKKGDFDVDSLGKAHEFTIFGGESLLILGTEDRRTILGASYGYVRPDKRLAFRGYPAQMVQEIKFDYSRALAGSPRLLLRLGRRCGVRAAHLARPTPKLQRGADAGLRLPPSDRFAKAALRHPLLSHLECGAKAPELRPEPNRSDRRDPLLVGWPPSRPGPGKIAA